MTPNLERRLCDTIVRLTEETAVLLVNHGALLELFARRVPGLGPADIDSLLKQVEVLAQLGRTRQAEAAALRDEFDDLRSQDF